MTPGWEVTLEDGDVVAPAWGSEFTPYRKLEVMSHL